MVKRIFILTLAAAILLGCAGCGKAVPEESTAGTGTETSGGATETAKVDLGGYEFTLVNGGRAGVWYAEPSTDEQQAASDIVNGLAKEYNFAIEDRNAGYGSVTLVTPFIAAGAAGEKFADFIYCEQNGWGDAALKGYLKRLDTAEVKAAGLDVTDGSVFDQNLINAVRIGGGVYSFDICGKYRSAQIGQVLAFNKTLVAGAGYPAEAIYQAVREGVWTWDVFADICRAGSKVGEYRDYLSYEETANWIYGVSRLDSFAAITAMGGTAVRYENGKYVSDISSFAFVSACNRWKGIFSDSNVYRKFPKTSTVVSIFYDGRALFHTFENLETVKEHCGFAYGIVPYPTWSSIDGYRSVVSYCSALCMQEANAEWKKACFVMEKIAGALGSPGAGFACLEKYVCDAESVEMIREYILPGLYVVPTSYAEGAMDVYTLLQNDILAGMGVLDAAGKHKEAFDAAVEEAFRGVNK